MGDIGKELGRRWKEVTSEEKEQCEAKAQKLKAEYEVKMKEYKQGKAGGDDDDADDDDKEDIDDAAMDEDD